MVDIWRELTDIGISRFGWQLRDPMRKGLMKLNKDYDVLDTDDLDILANSSNKGSIKTKMPTGDAVIMAFINSSLALRNAIRTPAADEYILNIVEQYFGQSIGQVYRYNIKNTLMALQNGINNPISVQDRVIVTDYGSVTLIAGNELPMFKPLTEAYGDVGLEIRLPSPVEKTSITVKVENLLTGDILTNEYTPTTTSTTGTVMFTNDAITNFIAPGIIKVTITDTDTGEIRNDIRLWNEVCRFGMNEPERREYVVTRTVDFYNNTKSIEGDVNDLQVYNLMRRCNVADDGTINAFYGDENYTEDGSNGQVMVYVKKFYYKMIPITLGNPDNHKLLKGSWTIADTQIDDDFKLHPAFYDATGNQIDYFLYGAFEAVGQDSNGVYSSSYNTTSYKLSSVGGNTMKPITGFSRATARTMATNRGTGWYSTAIWQHSAIQMLFGVEFGFNSQVAVGNGICNDSSMHNTGETTGNTTSGTRDNTTTAVNWRGIENLWGNVFNWNDGINFYNRTPYICDTFNFVDDTSTGYTQVVFGLPLYNWVSEFGYDENFDWLLLPIESTTTDKSNDQIGDRVYSISQNAWKICRMGGQYTVDTSDGIMCWSCDINSNNTGGDSGARLMYIPQI